MKIFKVTAKVVFPEKGKDYSVLLQGTDDIIAWEFTEACKAIVQKMKKKYKVGTPKEIRKSREKIIDELASKVCRKLGLTALKIEGEYPLKLPA